MCGAEASASSSSEGGWREGPYEGAYGRWWLDESDRAEVYRYRAGLVTSGACATAGCALALLAPDHGAGALEPLYFASAAGLGLALWEVHMYLGGIKRFMQAMWALGMAGSVAVAASVEPALPLAVAGDPRLVWAVGPLFVALTGLAFKEGACYGKPEAAALFFLVPSVLLGHLSGLASEGPEQVGLACFMLLYAVFSGRKFTQPLKDDVGDKSVFVFQAMTPDEQDAAVRRLEAAKLMRAAGLEPADDA